MEEQKIKELVDKLNSAILNDVEGMSVITTPFTDNDNEPIEIGLVNQNGSIQLNDLGRISGLLFGLGQHSVNSPAFLLVKNLADIYNITIDYDCGVLSRSINDTKDYEALMDFIKVVLSVHVAAPEVKQYRKTFSRSTLVHKISREFFQMQLPNLETQIDILGQNEMWSIAVKYVKPVGKESVDVFVAVADLSIKEPKQKASNILAMSVDLLEKIPNRELRVVYEVDGIGQIPEVQRAKNLIDSHQRDFKYRAFNFADVEQKAELLTLSRQDTLNLI